MALKAFSHRHAFGAVTVLCLVALRMAVGWHFFTDGVKKLAPDFRSTWFLQQAKGPFAEQFYGLIPDRFGMDRLDQSLVTDQWTEFSQTAVGQLKLDEDKKRRPSAF